MGFRLSIYTISIIYYNTDKAIYYNKLIHNKEVKIMLMVEKLGIINIKKFCDDVCKIVGIDVDKPENESSEIPQPSEKVLEEDKNKHKSKSSMSEQVKSENVCPVKVIPKKENKYKVQIDKKKDESDKITMADRKTNPVKVVPSKKSKVKVGTKDKVDENLDKFKNRLDSIGINYRNIKRKSTGLVELNLIQNNGNNVTISADIDNKIYGSGYMTFFIGKIPALAEYTNKPIILNDTTLKCIVEDKPIDPKYYVPEDLVRLNAVLNITTLKEGNKKKREKVLDTAFRAIESLSKEIIDISGPEAVRFAFAKYKGENEFSLVSSKRNLVSNLSNEKLNTDKEIWINIKKVPDSNKYDIVLDYNPNK